MIINDWDSPYLYESKPQLAPKKRKLLPDPLKGFLIFWLLLYLFAMVGYLFVYYLDAYGNALLEILLFGVGSVMACVALGWKRKEVFPVGKLSVTGVLAVLLLWMGTCRLNDVIFEFTRILFPVQYALLDQTIDEFSLGMNLWEQLLVIGIVPAITEEMLHRGLLQYSLRGAIKNWIIYLMMGLYFGAFHTSGVRFLPMMTLGIVMAYVRQQTGNILYPMLLHFVNNAWSVILPYIYMLVYGSEVLASSANVTLGQQIVYAGQALVEASVVPFVLWCGAYLLIYEKQDQKKGIFGGVKHPRLCKVMLIAWTLLSAVTGVLVMLAGMLF